MQINRNRRNTVFRDKRSRSGRYILLLTVVFAMVMGALVVNQPTVILETIDEVFAPVATPTLLPSDIAQMGIAEKQLGNLEGAADLFYVAIQQRPDSVDYLYEYGNILIDLGEAEQAQEIASDIASLSPTDVRGFTLRSRALVWQGLFTAAIPVALTAIEVDPSFAPTYAVLSRAYTGNNDWQEGVRYGELAVQYAPNDVQAHWAYANSLTAVGAYDDAILSLRQANEMNPVFLPPYFELAFLYLASNRDQEAIDIYDRILGIQPRNARALLRQCEAYRKIGEFQRAIGFCEDSVRSDPTYAPAQLRLGSMLYNERFFSEAQEAFQACVDLEPQNLQCTYRLGLAHYYMQDCDTAWDTLQNALIMAQVIGDSATDVVVVIREGLGAITSDPACPGFGSELFSTPTPEPEATEEPDVGNSA